MSATRFPLLKAFRETLADKPPFCSGTLALPSRGFTLYYGQDKDARRLDLSGTSPAHVEALDELEKACDPAPFGRKQETVLDESYRKAGKMDIENFMIGLEVNQDRLVDIVRAGLLVDYDENEPIMAELYKLNVYGKGAFFKSHKDTPRGTHMFGSLVVVFPTPHEGGELVLRHQGDEWTFDAAQILSSFSQSESKRIAYIAFFSNVEHEVLPVTSGHRLTITYNLYWTDPPPVALPPAQNLTVLYPKHSNKSVLEDALRALLDDSRFLPNGGTLGFALRHDYPFPQRWVGDMPDPLDSLEKWLKGSDKALYNACKSLTLSPFLRLVHDSEDDGAKVMMDHMVNLKYLDEIMETEALIDEGAIAIHSMGFDGKPLAAFPVDEYGSGDSVCTLNVYWVTELDEERNKICSEYMYYGNDASLSYLYVTVSLFVDVGRFGDRTNTQGGYVRKPAKSWRTRRHMY